MKQELDNAVEAAQAGQNSDEEVELVWGANKMPGEGPSVD